VTSESQETPGPSEQHHLLYIDPFYLDRRNFDPDQLLTGTSNNPHYGQDPHVEVLSATASASDPQTRFESSHHSFTSPSQNPPQASLRTNTSTPGSTETVFTCPTCLQTFQRRYLLNRHSKSHSRDFKCTVPDCPDRGSRYHKDLVRHMQSKHPEVEGFNGYYCTVVGCSRSVGIAFFRKDNFLRHMTTQHQHVPDSQAHID